MNEDATPNDIVTTSTEKWRMFLHALVGNSGQQGYVELFHMTAGTGRASVPASRVWIPHDAICEFPYEIPNNHHVYYGVAPRKRPGDNPGVGSLQNCFETNMLNVDMDLKTAVRFGAPGAAVLTMSPPDIRAAVAELAHAALARCVALGLQPWAVVDTGHGLQLLFRLPTVVTHDTTQTLNRGLGRLLGADFGHDPSTSSPAQKLRLPGSMNVKNPARPLPVVLRQLTPDAVINPAILEATVDSATRPVTTKRRTANDGKSIIDTFNARFSITELLDKYGYKRESEQRYTRPGDGASGNDVQLVLNAQGILCSRHYSGNDPLVGTPGDDRLRDPFQLFCDQEHGGDVKSAVQAAAAMVGAGGSRAKGPGEASEPAADETNHEKKPSAGTRAAGYALQTGGELWRDSASRAYLTVERGGHREHYRLPSTAAKDHIRHAYFQQEGQVLSAQALAEALALLQTRARVEGQEFVTGLRVVQLNGCTYLDLCDTTWQVVEIRPGQWRCISSEECPVRFVRPPGTLPLPVPRPGGTLQELAKFVNVSGPSFILCTAWLLGAVSGITPYPLLALGGEEGTGKSTLASVLKRIIDPHRAVRRRPPQDERDLFVASQHTNVLVYDNLSSIPDWLSDALCVLSTGGVFTTRTLYSDDEETVLEAQRPVVLNGIPDLLARPDLADRALTLTLQRIPPTERAAEADFWATFMEAHPRLLGALLTALSVALERLPQTHLTSVPRLADFARLIVAAEPALPWPEGEFLRTYTAMQGEAAELLLDDEPVADALRQLMDSVDTWNGTVKELLTALNDRCLQRDRPRQGWPTTPKKLGDQLRRLSTALHKTGYEVRRQPRSSRGIMVSLRKRAMATTSDVEAAQPMYISSVEAGTRNDVQDTPEIRSELGVLPGAPTQATTAGSTVNAPEETF